MLNKAARGSALAIFVYFSAFVLSGSPSTLAQERRGTDEKNGRHSADIPFKRGSLPPLDAHGVSGVQEISRPDLEKILSKSKALSATETAELDRGCLGLVCLYQALGVRRWPESARGTVAYLDLIDALRHRCPPGQENFVFIKQGWWLGGRAPAPIRRTDPVSVESVTRIRPGGFTFNYAVYFPETETFAWINHREYGFPLNLIKPQKVYLSASPPPLEDTRSAQIFCSTCR